MKLEINGKIVEVDESFASLSPEDKQKTVEEIAQSMNIGEKTPRSDIQNAGMLAAPAATGLGMLSNVPSASTMYQQGVKPFMNVVPAVAKSYVNQPVKAAVDLGAMAVGVPIPPIGTIEGAKGLSEGFKAGKQVAGNIMDALSKLPSNAEKMATPFVTGLNQIDQGRLLRAINEQGLESAIKSFQIPNYFNPEQIASLKATQNAFPGTLTKVGRAAMPVLGMAGRVLGPAGLAYDVYEAGQHYVPPSGPVAPQMAQARRAMLNAPTPAPLTPTEAQNLLSSGDTRTINIYGGPDKLNQIIRQEAARRIIPVIPQ